MNDSQPARDSFPAMFPNRASSPPRNAAETTSGGLHFRTAAGGAGFRYSHGTWVDARGERTPVAVRWDGNHARLSVPRTLAWASLEIVLAGAAFVLMAPLTRALQTYLFAGWPDAWEIRLGTNGQYGDGALLVTAALLLLGTVIVAPVVEELYFRGYLLPRMPQRLGRWRAPTHVVLFAAYHLWSPWLIPTRVLAILPLAYIAVRTRDVRIGVVTHVVLNATDLVAILLYLQAAPLNGRG